MVTISTGGLGQAKEGFFLTDVYEINMASIVLAGGAAVTNADITPLPAEGYYDEILSLFVYCDEVPATTPALRIEQTIDAAQRLGISTDLTIGDVQVYQLDLSAKKIRAYKTANIDQRASLDLHAHAVNETTFYVRGLIARYRMPTPS